MQITFSCERCHKEVKAPESAAGRRGKCPFCNESTYIPMPVSDEDVLPLAPIDEQEEAARQARIKALLEQEKELLAETGGSPEPPLEDREQVASQDLHHFVVNYCLDMFNGKLERAETHARKLRRYDQVAFKAIDDFTEGDALEPALDLIPKAILAGFLSQLRQRLR